MRKPLTTTLLLGLTVLSTSLFGQQTAGKNTQASTGACTAVVFGATARKVSTMKCKLFAVGSDATNQAAIDNAKSQLKQEANLDHILDPSEAPYRTKCGVPHGAVAGVPAPTDMKFSQPVNDCEVLLYTRFASTKEQAESQAVQDCIDVATHSMPRGVDYFKKYCQVLKSW